jgi:PST family polysaccharide transporter
MPPENKSNRLASDENVPWAAAIELPPRAEAADPNHRHFRTDHLLGNLKQRTISSGVVTLGSQSAKFAINMATTVILARLLPPHDFGLLAMVASVMGLLRIFKDAGLSSATIQKEDITHAQVSNLFWVNMAISAVLALIMAAAAPVIAWFYREPELIGITLWLSLTFLLSGSTVQHQALLVRQMRFKAVAVIEVGCMAAGLLAGVIMALLGCGYWSLVGLNLAMEGAGFLLSWSLSSWRPQLPKRNSGTRPLLNFGVSMTAGSAVAILSQSVDTILLGRFYGSDAVGLYSRAMALLMRPLQQLIMPVGSVFRPALSRLQGEPDRYRRAFMQLYEAMALVGFVTAGLFLAVSRPMTLVLLGPKWVDTSPIFGAFALAALFVPLAYSCSWLVVSQGRGKDFVLMSTINSAITVASFFIGLPFGPVGVAMSFSLCGLLIQLPVSFYLVGKSGPVRAKDLWFGFWRHLPLWITVLCATGLTLQAVSQSKPVVQLIACVPAGLAAALVTMLVLPYQRAIVAEGVKAAREMLSRRQMQKAAEK